MEQSFRCKRNCQRAIQILRTDIKEALSKPKGTMNIVLLAYQKAFDSIDRGILIYTLNKIGIKGKILKAFSNIVAKLKLPSIIYLPVIQGDHLRTIFFYTLH